MQHGKGGREVLSGPGEGTPIPGIDARIKLSGAETGELYAVQELEMPPGIRVPRHVHARESEAWYVVTGTLTFYLGERTFEAPAGSLVHLPVGVPHSFGNASDAPSKFLEILAPPGLERYFLDRAAMARPGEPGRDYSGLTPEEHLQLAEKYGLTFLDD